MAKADCLVLPSLYDGWGAVETEALMCGTPAICSDKSGSVGVVKKSGVGGVFDSKNLDDLQKLLSEIIQAGHMTGAQRLGVKKWSHVLCAGTGVRYLLKVLTYTGNGSKKPTAPWDSSI